MSPILRRTGYLKIEQIKKTKLYLVLWNRNDLLRFRFQFQFRIQTYLAQFFNNQKFVKKLEL